MVFRMLQYPRSEEQVERTVCRRSEEVKTNGDSFMEVASEELRAEIITEWQDAMCTRNVRLHVCAVCGRRMPVSDVKRVDVGQIDLTLLRNEDLLPWVLPTMYVFELYDGVLLHSKGLKNVHVRDEINICCTCESNLCLKRRMPKYMLVNWLYYRYDELPPDIRRAFLDLTTFDQILISRARASKILFQFSEMKGNVMYRTDPETLQCCIKRNMMVMPQDLTHLNNLLPPC